MKTVIVPVNATGMSVAALLVKELPGSEIVIFKKFTPEVFAASEAVIFIGAMGICVRCIAPMLRDKYTDPAVVCVDSAGRHAISVVSGHIGGANDLCRQVAGIVGADPVVTTQSDTQGLWALDTFCRKYGWLTEASREEMNRAITRLVNGDPVALLIDVRDRGVAELRRTLPPNVREVTSVAEAAGCRLLIAVTPRLISAGVPVLCFRPRVLTLGVGCRRGCAPEGVADAIEVGVREAGFSPLAIRSVASIELKKDEPLLADLAGRFGQGSPVIYTADELKDIRVPNPSVKVREVTGVDGVAESCAIRAASMGPLVMEKHKGGCADANEYTFALALDRDAVSGGHIEIVGAGPGDPELVSVRGQRFLAEADLILYAGSLVPRELTFYAKPGCVVRSSASMNLEEQFALMKGFYDRGQLVVRLHTGDPCIYGAIQEQMALFDRYNMSYHITPGISSFQAAAAALRSQFTIPEKVQTIILTRGEGRTPMPEREQLHKLAQSQSTMCIYLSAGVVDDVQRELLTAYPPETPVAACYKLTWKEERIYRGQLKDLAKIVHDNNLTLTTLLVVGDAIDNRAGLSRLYDEGFTHLFRK